MGKNLKPERFKSSTLYHRTNPSHIICTGVAQHCTIALTRHTLFALASRNTVPSHQPVTHYLHNSAIVQCAIARWCSCKYLRGGAVAHVAASSHCGVFAPCRRGALSQRRASALMHIAAPSRCLHSHHCAVTNWRIVVASRQYIDAQCRVISLLRIRAIAQ